MKNLNVIYILKEVLLWAASLYLAWLFIQQGYVKFDAEGFWSGAFERWGYPVWFMFLIGFLECLGAILILIPRTGAYGGNYSGGHYGRSVLSPGSFMEPVQQILYGSSFLVWAED